MVDPVLWSQNIPYEIEVVRKGNDVIVKEKGKGSDVVSMELAVWFVRENGEWKIDNIVIRSKH